MAPEQLSLTGRGRNVPRLHYSPWSDSAGVSSTFRFCHYLFRAHSTQLPWDSLLHCLVRLQTVVTLCGGLEGDGTDWPRAQALTRGVSQNTRRVYRLWLQRAWFKGRTVAQTTVQGIELHVCKTYTVRYEAAASVGPKEECMIMFSSKYFHLLCECLLSIHLLVYSFFHTFSRI